MNEQDEKEFQEFIDAGWLERGKTYSNLRESFPLPTFDQVVEQYKERLAHDFLSSDFSGFGKEAERE